MAGTTSTLDISARLDRLPGNPMLWSWVGRLSLGGFFEIYDLALTALLSPLLVGGGVFRAGTDGLLGYPDQASFAFLTMLGLFLGSLGLSGVADTNRRVLGEPQLVWRFPVSAPIERLHRPPRGLVRHEPEGAGLHPGSRLAPFTGPS